MKRGVRICAIASGPVRGVSDTILVGVVYRDGIIEGVLSSRARVDGDDAAKRVVGMLAKSRFRDQVKMIAVNGNAIAGLNFVDLGFVSGRLGVEVAVVTRARPVKSRLLETLARHAERTGVDVSRKILLLESSKGWKTHKIEGIYVQSRLRIGELRGIARQMLESLRLAHLIASGVSMGESRGRI